MEMDFDEWVPRHRCSDALAAVAAHQDLVIARLLESVEVQAEQCLFVHLEDDDAATECAECDEPEPEVDVGSCAGVLTPVSPDIAVLSNAFTPRISLLWSTTGFGSDTWPRIARSGGG